MLQSLTIRNIVLIERLQIDFDLGLCALTGETGAGKSILLDSLSLVLGARGDSGLVRKGADKASVSAQFDLPEHHPVYKLLSDHDIETEDIIQEGLIIRRVVNADGRSKAFINDIPVSIGVLKTLAPELVEVHGQYDNRGLLDPARHRQFLDQYLQLDSGIQKLWESWQTLSIQLQELETTVSREKEEEDFLRKSLEDLEELDPQQGEEEKLSQIRDKLRYREQIIEGFTEALEALTNAEDMAGQAYRSLDRRADKAGDILDPVLQAMDRSSSEKQEAISLIQSAMADMNEEGQSLESVDDRLYELRAHARRHHCLVDDLPVKRENLAEKLDRISNSEDLLSNLRDKVRQAREMYIQEATKLHDKRVKAAKELDRKIMKELGPLKLEKAVFKTSVEMLEESEWGPHGMDKVRFEVATNPGTDPGPLNKVASGGEMARIMLAIKVVLGADQDVTMIFDEVDSGVGGSTADAVGERLARLGEKRQVMVVTHSPQVAARARHHMIVMKESNDKAQSMTTKVIRLSNDNDRTEEIARMLAGAEISDEARAAASRLLGTEMTVAS